MIATLRGKITEKFSDKIVIDVSGVGYGVLVALEDYAKLNKGDEIKVYIYEHIREAAHDLFGFTSMDTMRLFEQLLGVNGVGPKMALGIMGIGSADDVRQAIAAGDTKFITTAQGVGKRVAERIVIELKNKVGLLSTANEDSLFIGTATAEQDEAVQALMALGYDVQDAVAALKGVDSSLPTEDKVKQALKGQK
ncbi:MAG: Holliday junction branch migration protein RuvA [Candidatus Saccharibacteria bacterium]|nr:Holliday junction branch migration protein RuvA [Candidatus Saccharibacteria bacterium]